MSLTTPTWFANIDHKWEINRKQRRIRKTKQLEKEQMRRTLKDWQVYFNNL